MDTALPSRGSWESGESTASEGSGIDFALLEDMMAFHEKEVRRIKAANAAKARKAVPPASPKQSAQAQDPRAESAKDGFRKDVLLSPNGWKERAFPGLAERRWLQLCVDETTTVWADPVTRRQFIPSSKKGEFLEIDMEHAHFIDPQELNEAIKDFEATQFCMLEMSPSHSKHSDSTDTCITPGASSTAGSTLSTGGSLGVHHSGRVAKAHRRSVTRKLEM